jgi:ABC-type transport system substrate-binding protein
MRSSWGRTLAVVCALAGIASACSSSSSSGGTVTTSAATSATSSGSPTSEASATTTGSSDGGTETTQAAKAQGGDLKVGLDSEPPTLDPAGNSLSIANGTVYAAIYETLLQAIPGEPLKPLLLSEMPTESADRMSWTLSVRPGIKFHDGTPFDGNAIKANLEAQKLSPYNGPSLIPVTAVDVDPTDPMKVVLHLSGPWTALPELLAGVDGLMASPKAIADKSLARNPVGTGPYKFSQWAPGQQIVVVKNPDYWGTEKAPLDSMTFKFVPVEASRIAAFDAGEVDAYTSIYNETADKAKSSGAQVFSPAPSGYGLTLWNNTKAPLDDARVREALEMGYDRDAVTSAYKQGQGYADAAFSPMVKDSTWWVAPETQQKYDPDAAKKLIAEYGKPVKFTYLLLKGSQITEDQTRAMIDYWKKIGADVTLQIIPDIGTYVASAVSGNYDAIAWIGTAVGDPDTILYNMFHTGGATNYEKYSNPQVDQLLEQNRASDDEAQRHQGYDQIQQILRHDQPVGIQSHGSLYVIANDKLTGFDPSYFFPSRTVAFKAS